MTKSVNFFKFQKNKGTNKIQKNAGTQKSTEKRQECLDQSEAIAQYINKQNLFFENSDKQKK